VIDGESKYAGRAREILLGYADRYNRYPRPGQRPTGRILVSRIFETRWVMQLAWSYDLIYSSGLLSAADRKHIEDDLLRACAESICLKRKPWGSRNNWWVRFTMATGFIGFCVKDMDYVEFGLRCFDTMMEERVQQDGMWPETIGYHFYSWDAMIRFTEAAANCGLNMYENPVYRKMHSIPLKLTYPDGGFVPDGDVPVDSRLSSQRHFYDVISHRYEDETINWVLHHAYNVQKEEREHVFSFLFSPTAVPTAGDPTFESLQTDTLTRLSTGDGDACRAAWLDCGVVGGHQHPDRLNLSLWANNRILAPDIGTCPYDIPQYEEWIKTGLSHNLVVIDEGDGNHADGRTASFGVTPCVKIIDAVCPGLRTRHHIKQRRIVALFDSYLVDFYDVEDVHGKEHQYDWVYHNYGELTVGLPLEVQETSLGPKNGYQCVSDIRRGRSDEQWEATWCQGKKSQLRLTMLGEQGTEIVAGTGIGNPVTERIPLVIARRKATRTAYISVLEPYRESPGVREISGISGAGLQGIKVRREQEADYFVVNASESLGSFEGISLRGALGAICVREDKTVRYMYLVKGRELTGQTYSIRTDSPSTIYLDFSDPMSCILEHQGEACCEVRLRGDFGRAPALCEMDGKGDRRENLVMADRESGLEFSAKPGTRYRIHPS